MVAGFKRQLEAENLVITLVYLVHLKPTTSESPASFKQVRYLLSVLPGPIDVVAPCNDDGKLVTDTQSSI